MSALTEDVAKQFSAIGDKFAKEVKEREAMATLWPLAAGAATNPFTVAEITAWPGGGGDSNPTTQVETSRKRKFSPEGERSHSIKKCRVSESTSPPTLYRQSVGD